jgi:hypothetical protein
MPSKRVILFLAILLLTAGFTYATPPDDKPLTNQDVIAMVKSLLPESVILGSIKTSATDFDISATGLIALKKAGVSTKVMEAMLDAVNKKNAPPAPAAATPVAGAASSAAPAQLGAAGTPSVPMGVAGMGFASPASVAPVGFASAWQPTVSAILQGGTKASLAAEATQIVLTKTKPTSLSALAADQALSQALQVGAQSAQQAMMKSGSAMALTALNPGFAVVNGLMAYRAKSAKVTYVWALNGGSSPANVGTSAPSFETNYAGLPGVNPDQFEPVIVKLSPTPQANYRLVGATEGAASAGQDQQQDWPIYSSFVEDRIACKVDKLGSGRARVTPATALAPGEYAIALRPTDKAHKFSGEEVGKNQAEGLLFNYAWPFSVK